MPFNYIPKNWCEGEKLNLSYHKIFLAFLQLAGACFLEFYLLS